MISIGLKGNQPIIQIDKKDNLSVGDLVLIIYYLKHGQFAHELTLTLKTLIEEEDMEKILTSIAFTESAEKVMTNFTYVDQCMTPIVSHDMVKFQK